MHESSDTDVSPALCAAVTAAMHSLFVVVDDDTTMVDEEPVAVDAAVTAIAGVAATSEAASAPAPTTAANFVLIFMSPHFKSTQEA
ncbi:hypothetical protein BIU89_07505 [Curtobacterium sp. MCBA15_005]|nr:hypothetical protein BIU89_07505 [Curtobacterium sp. MCBA15_005]